MTAILVILNPLTRKPFEQIVARGAETTTVVDNQIALCETNGGVATVQLPAPAALRAGMVFAAVDIDGNASTDPIVVDGNGTQIDGQATVSIDTAFTGAAFVYDGQAFRRATLLRSLGGPPPQDEPFTLAEDVFAGGGAAPVPGVASTIIWQPGVPSAGNHVETAAEVEAAVLAAQGFISVLVDDRAAPAVIPATMDLEGFGELRLAAFSSTINARIRIADGGRIKNLATLDNLVIIAAPTVRPPLYFNAVGAVLDIVWGVIANDVGATKAMVEIDAPVVVFYQTGKAALDNSAVPAVPMVHVDAGRIFGYTVVDSNFAPFTTTMVEGAVGTTFLFEHDASIQFVAQALMLGTVSEQRVSFAAALQPSAGATRPAIAYVGQEHLDTALVPIRPIWLRSQGPNVWIDATGAVV